jgi:PAS domain-containing protein
MTLVPARHVPRVLLACDDPLESQLLRSLLRALPGLRPEVIVAEPDSPAWTAALAEADCCFLSFSSLLPLAELLARLRAAAPRLRVIGVLSAQSRFGDRAELLQALRAGLSDAIVLEELSATALAALVQGPSARRTAETVTPAAVAPPAMPAPVAAGQPRPATDAALAGSWRIALAEQRANFDAGTLERLGYVPAQVGSGLGDWKSLIHADDIDRLVGEVHGVLNGSAPPHPLTYRLREHDGGWLPVVSDDIAVELDELGSPRAISGRFYQSGAPEAVPARGVAAPDAMPVVAADYEATAWLLALLDTAVLRLQRDSAGAFRVAWCNAAAGALEQRAPAELVGLRPPEYSPPFDGFDLEEALARVHQTGIAEVREVMALDRGEQPHWRSYRISPLPSGEVLVEAADVSEAVGARVSRRVQDEMAQYIVRALPLTALLVDEQGRVVQGIAVAGGVLGEDAASLEDRTLAELLGAQAGTECRLQIQKTLNTGRIASAVYAVDGATGKQWLECRSAALRGRPGMAQRALLIVQDTTEQVRELAEARLARDQVRAAIHRVPVPLFLKDVEGRYLAINPAFGELFGVEEGMLLGKTDLEVFPDELAMELHEADRRLIASGSSSLELRTVGQGASRGEHYCFGFPVGTPGRPATGTGGILIATRDLPRPRQHADAAAAPAEAPASDAEDGIAGVAASVVGRVEQVLAEAGDYAGVLRRLEQLAETTMHAQALIHEVAGQAEASSPQPLIALTPLAQNIIELERILMPASARLDNEIAGSLPPAHCDPVVFHQVLLRGIRHARRGLGHDGTLGIRLRLAQTGRRSCVSCREGFEGNYIELVIEDSGSRLSEQQIRGLAAAPPPEAAPGSALDDLAEIHALVHGQGGHLQIRQGEPSGTSLHIYLRAATPEQVEDRAARARSTVTRFPFIRLREPRDSN